MWLMCRASLLERGLTKTYMFRAAWRDLSAVSLDLTTANVANSIF